VEEGLTADGRWDYSYDPDGRGPLTEKVISVWGISLFGLRKAKISWPPGTKSFTETALAHELGHFFLEEFEGGGDHEHKDPMFLPGGEVDKANNKLRSMGL
jgi:hypothetical protein